MATGCETSPQGKLAAGQAAAWTKGCRLLSRRRHPTFACRMDDVALTGRPPRRTERQASMVSASNICPLARARSTAVHICPSSVASAVASTKSDLDNIANDASTSPCLAVWCKAVRPLASFSLMLTNVGVAMIARQAITLPRRAASSKAPLGEGARSWKSSAAVCIPALLR